MIRKIGKAAGIVVLAALLGGIGIGTAQAQGPAGDPGQPGGVRVTTAAFPGFGLECSTTNYTDVAAKALGMDSAALRQALAGGKTLEEIASSKNVTLQTVTDAFKAALNADLDQALKDGLITQQAHDQMKNMFGGTTSSAGAATPAAPGGAQGGAQSGGAPNGGPGRGMGFGFGEGRGAITVGRFGRGFPFLAPFNEVRPFVEASKALNMSCADLVKATQGGQSVAQVAQSKNTPAQTVIDALVNAQKATIAQDLKEGLISQVEADRRTADTLNWAGMFLYQSGGPRFMMNMGFGVSISGVGGDMQIQPPSQPDVPR